MGQSRKLSLIESACNILVGLVASFVIQLVLYPMMNIEVSVSQNITITLVFFVVSFVRGYLIRRFFNNLK